MDERYELRKGSGKTWEVAHHWSDGVTVQVRYFKTMELAMDYLKEKTG